jgi:AhpD family alkylhydroperoxidase
MERGKSQEKGSGKGKSSAYPKQDAKKCYEDIREKLGFVPQFAQALPESSIVGAWEELKGIYLNPDTLLSVKTKDLIGLAVVTQSPSRLSAQYSKEMSKLSGVSAEEAAEAVAIAGVTAHWSSFLNGLQVEDSTFKNEVDRAVEYAKRQLEDARAVNVAESELAYMAKVENADEAYRDIDATLGGVPEYLRKLPMEALPGAWMELKNLQFNPNSPVALREKQLIGLAVASQIPCKYTVYMHKQVAKLHGATEREVEETLAVSAVSRHWNAVINGAELDEASFRNELQQLVQHLNKQRAV